MSNIIAMWIIICPIVTNPKWRNNIVQLKCFDLQLLVGMTHFSCVEMTVK
jgi:hypothetical protein